MPIMGIIAFIKVKTIDLKDGWKGLFLESVTKVRDIGWLYMMSNQLISHIESIKKS